MVGSKPSKSLLFLLFLSHIVPLALTRAARDFFFTLSVRGDMLCFIFWSHPTVRIPGFCEPCNMLSRESHGPRQSGSASLLTHAGLSYGKSVASVLLGWAACTFFVPGEGFQMAQRIGSSFPPQAVVRYSSPKQA